ncbi:nuclear transport factor 2 family protein [uncultured Winogradskyella sp.]|uniref:nuclear transport factor 2 family protein n=1 Tax=uncultured Winogradskyella sp. TaxID=395353 RepID=UPI0030D93DFD|tara:strand:+ start:1136 stop:2395 length:1260 start_codon:yes stop_codon:yes gene_type:complete
MKYTFFLAAITFFTLSYSQSNTEVYLFDISTVNNKISITNNINISNSKEYDNQPSFLDDRYIVFSSTRNGQTDIAKYDTRYNGKIWINFTEGGEYSPLKITNKNAVSAVRLDKDGKQRLYSYNLSNGESTELIEDLVVAYYTWYDENTIVSAVIEGDDLNLYITDLKERKSRQYATKVGRSFHKIPNSNLVSFISKKNNKQWQIKSLDPITGETKVIANTLSGVEDISWLNNSTLLSGKGSVLYKLTLKRDNNWKIVANLSSNGITKITRLTTNATGSKLLLVGDIDQTTSSQAEEENKTTETDTENSEVISILETLIQKQLDAYNARDVNAFMSAYTEDIKLYNYPNELLSEGQDQMRKDYVSWFKRTPDLKAASKKRIIIGNKVIDHEQITANGKVFNTVAIYEIENGLISKVTFMQ